MRCSAHSIRLSDWLPRRLTNARPSAPAGGLRPENRTPVPRGNGECLAKTPCDAVSESAALCHFVIDMLVNRPISFGSAPTAEVCSPALQLLIQPLTHFRPWFHTARHQEVSRVRRESHARFCERPVVKFQSAYSPTLDVQDMPQKVDFTLGTVEGLRQALIRKARPLIVQGDDSSGRSRQVLHSFRGCVRLSPLQPVSRAQTGPDQD
jgi:hypothetical protein